MEDHIIATNRKAFHDFSVTERVEAGLVLTGSEVKSMRAGKASLAEGWVDFRGNEAWLVDVHVARYTHGGYSNHEERRPRKLLLSRKEIDKLAHKASTSGVTVIPLRLYFKGSLIKIELGVAKGKKSFDKREATKEREVNRELARAMRK
jgi:SsrA-binding protein